MDYTRFRFRAVVDWLEIEMTTAKPTNFPTIRRKGALCYVKPLDATTGGAASRFRFRIYDLENWGSIRQVIAEIERTIPLAKPPAVTAVEVSFDAYSRGATRAELIALATNFVHFNTTVISNNRRIAGRFKGDTEGVPSHAYVSRKIAAGREVVIGNKTDPISQRVYFKTTDFNGKPIKNASEHRARIEVTLQGEGLPISALDDWKAYSFEQLACYFKFRAFKDGLDPITQKIVGYPARIGERRVRNRREGGTRLYGKATRADTVLNRKAYDALRELTRRMSSSA